MDSSLNNPSDQIEPSVEKPEEEKKEQVERRMSYPHFISLLVFSIALIIGVFIFSILSLKNPLNVIAVNTIIVIFTVFAFLVANEDAFEGRGKFHKVLDVITTYMIPIDEKKFKPGAVSVLRYIFLLMFGIAFYIFGYSFIAWREQAPTALLSYYGFLSFINVIDSVMPTILFLILIICPLLFVCFLLMSAMAYKDETKAYSSYLVIFLPIILILPYPLQFILNLSAGGPASVAGSVVQTLIVFILFAITWIITLLLWFRPNRRGMFICFAIFLVQVVGSTFIFYSDLIFTIFNISSPSPTYPFSSFQLYGILAIWFLIMAAIPIGLKIFDNRCKEERHFVYLLILAIVIGLAIFQILTSSILLPAVGTSSEAQIIIGFGYFYFMLYLLQLPAWFLFGYYQVFIFMSIGVFQVQVLSRMNPEKRSRALLIGRWTTFGLIFLWIIFYFILWKPISQGSGNLFAGFPASILSVVIFYSGSLTHSVALMQPSVIFLTNAILLVGNNIIIMGILVYSTFRTTHNLHLEVDLIPRTKESFFSPAVTGNYKSRVLLGFGVVSLILGIISLYAFLNMYYFYFIAIVGPSVPVTLVVSIYSIIDSMSFLISAIGFGYGSIYFIQFLFGERVRNEIKELKEKS